MCNILRLLSISCMILCSSLCMPVASPAARIITLEECLRLTMDYSRDILLANEGKNISQGRYVEERSAALPQFKIEAQSAYSHDPSYPVLGFNRERNDYSANLHLSQALFTWGQISSAIKAAEYDKESAEHQMQEARQLALREASTGFFDLLLSLELEKVASDNVAQKQRHLDEAKRKLQMEVATDYDVLAAQVALTNALPALAQAQNAIRLAKDRLRYFMGVQEDFEVTGSLLCLPKAPDSFEVVMERAIANRPEVAYYKSQLGVFGELVTVAKGGDKPRLDFKGNMGWSDTDDIHDDTGGGYWDAGVYFSFPIFDGFLTKGRVIQARSRLSTTEIKLKKLLDQIALEARDAINRVDESVQIVKALAATTEQAERLLQMAESGYRYGVKTRLEVDDAESNLLSARLNVARARRDYLVAKTRLLWIMGEDMQRALAGPDSTPKGICDVTP